MSNFSIWEHSFVFLPIFCAIFGPCCLIYWCFKLVPCPIFWSNQSFSFFALFCMANFSQFFIVLVLSSGLSKNIQQRFFGQGCINLVDSMERSKGWNRNIELNSQCFVWKNIGFKCVCFWAWRLFKRRKYVWI